MRFDFSLRTRFRNFTLILSPFSWCFWPIKYGSWWYSDFDDLTEYSIQFSFLCFSFSLSKRMDLTAILLDKSKDKLL